MTVPETTETETTLDRRRLLTLVGGTALTLPLAGCTSPGEGEDGEGEDGEDGEGGEGEDGEGGEGEDGEDGEGGEDEEDSVGGGVSAATGPAQSGE
jgi:hypothetical protein